MNLLKYTLHLCKLSSPSFSIEFCKYLAPAGITVTASAVGGYHTCALSISGDLWCWGSNGNGQLGIGSSVAQETSPMPVSFGEGIACFQAK